MNKKSNRILMILTPVILLLLCTGIIAAAAIKPYGKLSVYLNLAFMDEFKNNPNEGSGLVIKEGTIKTDYNGYFSPQGDIVFPSFGEQYAVLRTESISNDIPVYWGTTSELFEHGACQSTFSKVLGGVGNTVISAHEDTFFSELGNIKEGDIVTLYTNYGCFAYEASQIISFKKTDKSYVKPSDDEKLTLYTCKKNVLGSSDERVGVVCTLKEKKFYVDGGEVNE